MGGGNLCASVCASGAAELLCAQPRSAPSASAHWTSAQQQSGFPPGSQLLQPAEPRLDWRSPPPRGAAGMRRQ